MNLADVLETEILGRVEKPSRYLGNEVNADLVAADGLDEDGVPVEVRLALAFPDLYDLGLGNLGIHILYKVVNGLPRAQAERVYAPGLDMEHELRSRGLPLFAWESKDSLDQFDGIGFTLQSELTWTNILNIIDLAGMSLRTEGRREGDPLTFAGGPAVFNPEPLAPFMDFFVIGDGEDAIVEIAEVLRRTRGMRRASRLLALSRLEGVYVPALYPFEQLEDGRILPRQDAPPIVKRITKDLNGATFPTDYIVPYTQQVHDRVSLEVLRGCTQGCRFCQAGMVTRPVRERTLDRVDELLQRTLDATGYEEVSLVSLSTCDHSRVRQLVENTVERVRDQHASVSLPSLRLDSFSVDLADMVAETRRTGLTFAPEAASPRLRAVINKWIPDEELLAMSDRAFALGWRHVKLYFMIGLPTERDDDILAIEDLARRTLRVGRSHNAQARVNLGVSTFVPKPFTPFQWARQIGREETIRRQDLLQAALGREGKNGRLKFGRHEPEETFLEGLFSRTDRRAADLLEAAFRKGCRFDAWREHLRFDLWEAAIEETGFDVEDALRERDVHERLPWDHIDVLIPKRWFVEDWERAKQLQHAQDCRHRRCHKCGVISRERELCASMLRDNIEGRKLEEGWQRTPQPAMAPPKERVQRIWLRIARHGNARFLSHLEAMTAWVRALRRARTPLAYSQGFHPHPKVAFSHASPVGEGSVGDYLDVTLVDRVGVEAWADRLRATLPEGFDVLGQREVPLRSPSLMSLVAGASYRVAFRGGALRSELEARVEALMQTDHVTVRRRSKKRQGRRRVSTDKDVNVRPSVQGLLVEGPSPGRDGLTLRMRLVAVDGVLAKPHEVLGRLLDSGVVAHVIREDTFARLADGDLVSLGAWSARADAPQVAERSSDEQGPVSQGAPLL